MAATSLANVGFMTDLSPGTIRRPLDTVLVAGTHYLPTEDASASRLFLSRGIRLGAA
jgi:hypothetical protein